MLNLQQRTTGPSTVDRTWILRPCRESNPAFTDATPAPYPLDQSTLLRKQFLIYLYSASHHLI